MNDMRFHELKRYLLDYIYPNRCPFCDKEIHSGLYFCTECAEKLASAPESADNISPAAGLSVVTAYDDTAKRLVYEFKEGNNGYAASAAAYLMFRKLCADGALGGITVVTAVPMHRRDKARRGYNQSELVAKEIARLARKPYRRLLKKTKLNLPQKSLSAAERCVNVVGVYEYAHKKRLEGESVLLIDDVCTTGSTLREAASQLIIGGAARVYAAVFAKTENKP